MNQIVTLKEIKEQLSELLAKVASGDQKVVVTKSGKPLVAIVKYDEYEKLMNPASRFSKKDWENGFDFIKKARKASAKLSDEKATKLINKEIAIIRSLSSGPFLCTGKL